MARKPELESQSENYETLMAQLTELDPTKTTEATIIANKIKEMLLVSAKNTSRGNLDFQVTKLVSLMFNRFRVTTFDNLLDEVWAVQQNPVILRDPEKLEK